MHTVPQMKSSVSLGNLFDQLQSYFANQYAEELESPVFQSQNLSQNHPFRGAGCIFITGQLDNEKSLLEINSTHSTAFMLVSAKCLRYIFICLEQNGSVICLQLLVTIHSVQFILSVIVSRLLCDLIKELQKRHVTSLGKFVFWEFTFLV